MNRREDTRYIFVTGGVVSSLGKGIAAASLGALLEVARLQGHDAEVRPLPQRRSRDDEPVPARRGLRHRRRRRDRPRPRPLRALHAPIASASATTSPPAGSTTTVIEKERRGDYLGGDGAGHPAHHRRDQARDPRPGRRRTTCSIVEIGGTVGDIESLPFLEAIRQFRLEVGRDNALFIHLTLVPYIAGRATSSRPSRPSTRCGSCARSASSPTSCSAAPTGRCRTRCGRKIALFCNVATDAVIEAPRRRDDLRGAAAFSAEGLDEMHLQAARPAATASATSRPGRSWSRRVKNPRRRR